MASQEGSSITFYAVPAGTISPVQKQLESMLYLKIFDDREKVLGFKQGLGFSTPPRSTEGTSNVKSDVMFGFPLIVPAPEILENQDIN